MQIAKSPVPEIRGMTTEAVSPALEAKSINSILEVLHSPGRAIAIYDNVDMSTPARLRTNVVLTSPRSGEIFDKVEDVKDDSVSCIKAISRSFIHRTDLIKVS